MKKFLSRIKADLMCCTRIVKESEDRIRDFYQERIELKSEEFVEMILVDAVFIIELFMRKKSEEFRDDADEVSQAKAVAYYKNTIRKQYVESQYDIIPYVWV